MIDLTDTWEYVEEPWTAWFAFIQAGVPLPEWPGEVR